MVEFAWGAKMTLQDGHYYCPLAANQATFNGFIYQKKGKIATIFQITVVMKHEVKSEGFIWLQTLGVEKICYTVVTPPDTSLTLQFLNDLLNDLIPAKLQLVIMSKVLICFTPINAEVDSD